MNLLGIADVVLALHKLSASGDVFFLACVSDIVSIFEEGAVNLDVGVVVNQASGVELDLANLSDVLVNNLLFFVAEFQLLVEILFDLVHLHLEGGLEGFDILILGELVSLNHSVHVINFHTILDVYTVEDFGAFHHCHLLGNLLVLDLHGAQFQGELTFHRNLLH